MLILLVGCASTAGAPGKRSGGDRPACAQPFEQGACIEGTWPAAWRDGQWDCTLIQDQLELEGIPADRCTSFLTEEEVAARIGSRRPAAR